MLQLNPFSDVLAVFAAIVWAGYAVLSRKISSYGYNTIQTTRRIFMYGLLFLLPTLFRFGAEAQQLTKPVNLFNLLFLGLGASALCFVTWNTAVKLLGADVIDQTGNEHLGIVEISILILKGNVQLIREIREKLYKPEF